MPSTSKKQHNFMAAIANNPSFAKKVGIPQSVGSDFVKADKGRKFAKGGDMATKKKLPAFMMDKEDKEMKGKAKGNPFAKGKPFAKGGFVRAADGVATKGKTKAKQIKMAGGGSCK
jgi:hypothetical protein